MILGLLIGIFIGVALGIGLLGLFMQGKLSDAYVQGRIDEVCDNARYPVR